MEHHLLSPHPAQLGNRILASARLSEAVIAVGSDLVRPDDQGVRVVLHNRASLGFGEAGGGGGGMLARQG